MAGVHHDELLHIVPLDGLQTRSRPGADELAAAIAVLDLCREHEHLWRSVFRLRSVFGWTDTLMMVQKALAEHE